MRKTIYFWMLAAAALAFNSCNKEAELGNSEEQITHVATISLGKAADTKTAVIEGEKEASYKWLDDDNQYLHVYENGTEGTIDSFSLNADKTVATLTVSFTGNPTAPYTYTAKYADSLSKSKNPLILNEQYPGTESFDPAADVLVSKATDDVTNLNERATEFTFTMGRVVTVNKMTLTGLEAGEVISSVEFTLDKHMAGYVSYSAESNTYNYSDGGTKLTLKYTSTNGVVPANGQFPVYFVSAPVDAAAVVSVVVTTDKNVYTKSSSLDPNPFDGKTISFAIGTMTRFNMGLTGYGEPISTGTQYTLVSSQDDLYDGATYIIVGNNTDLVAMSTQTNNNRAKVDVTAENDVITVDNTIDAATFTINAVSGGYTIKDNNLEQYLYAAGGNSNNYLRSTISPGATATWSIEIEQGVASIVTSGATRGTMCYNTSNSIFSCYANIGSYKTLALYVDPDTCVPDTRTEVTLSFNPSEPESITLGDSFAEPTLTVNPSEAAVSYSIETNPADIATINATTGELDITGAGTITVTAAVTDETTYKPASASYTLTVNPPLVVNGSVDNPVSMADVVAAINNLGNNETTTDFYYVGGTVSVASTGVWSGKLTFSFTDGTNTIKAYNCFNLNGTDFSTKDDVAVGDNVVVYGNLEKYVNNNNEVTYEIVNCQLAKLEVARRFNATLSSDSIAAEGGDITLTISSNTSWTVSVTGAATLSSDSGSNDGSVTITIPQNNEGATYTLSFTADGVTPAPSDLTITQNAYVNLVSATAIFTGKKSGGMTGTQAEQTGVRRNVTAVVSSGLADATNDHIRVYKNNTLTLSVPSGAYITAIEFTGVSGNPVSGFGTHDGLTTSGDDGSWTGNANSVTFTASGAQVRLSQISVTYSIAEDALVTDAPSIHVTSANPMQIANTASKQTITYTIYDAPDGAALTGASSGATWISNIVYSTSGTVTFDVAAQEEDADARTATLTLSYNGATDVPVTVNQAEGPSSGGGNSTTTTYTFTSKAWADGTDSWTSGKDGNQMTSGRGVQVTTGATGAYATTNSSLAGVTSVVVTYSTNASNGAGSIAVKIGNNTAHSQNVTKTGGTTDRTLTYTIDPAESGAVTLTVTCTTNSIYVKSVAITHN